MSFWIVLAVVLGAGVALWYGCIHHPNVIEPRKKSAEQQRLDDYFWEQVYVLGLEEEVRRRMAERRKEWRETPEHAWDRITRRNRERAEASNNWRDILRQEYLQETSSLSAGPAEKAPVD